MSSVPRVTVVTICREPVDVVKQCAAWHRRMGADEVRILFDDLEDPAVEALSGHHWLRADRCDRAFWAAAGVAHDAPFAERQVAALTFAYRAVRDGWVAILDADEAFHFGGRSFGDVLSEVPDAVRAVRVRTAEYLVPMSGETGGRLHFRISMTKPEVSAVYRESARLFRPSYGLIGHYEGKSITRSGLKIRRMRPHWAVTRKERDLTDLHLGPTESACLLHFISGGYAPWRAKLDRRMAVVGSISVRLKNEVERIRAEEPDVEGALRALYAVLHQAEPGLIERLGSHGKHLALEDRFASAVAEVFGA